jgi:hypothetical protein
LSGLLAYRIFSEFPLSHRIEHTRDQRFDADRILSTGIITVIKIIPCSRGYNLALLLANDLFIGALIFEPVRPAALPSKSIERIRGIGFLILGSRSVLVFFCWK